MFQIPTTGEPRLSQAKVIKEAVEAKPQQKAKKSSAPKEKKVVKQVSVLFSEEQYETVFDRGQKEVRSMTYLVKKFLEDKGFFDD